MNEKEELLKKIRGLKSVFILRLTPSQYELLARYCEDLSKALMISSVIGFVLPSVLPSAIIPTSDKAFIGGMGALTLLGFAVKFVEKGKSG